MCQLIIGRDEKLPLSNNPVKLELSPSNFHFNFIPPPPPRSLARVGLQCSPAKCKTKLIKRSKTIYYRARIILRNIAVRNGRARNAGPAYIIVI